MCQRLYTLHRFNFLVHAADTDIALVYAQTPTVRSLVDLLLYNLESEHYQRRRKIDDILLHDTKVSRNCQSFSYGQGTL